MPTSFVQAISSFKKYWYVSVLAFSSVMAIAVLVILFAPRVFQSEARLMLRIGRESLNVDPTASADTLSMHRTRDQETQSALGVMRSREILEQVIEKVGVEVVLAGVPDQQEPNAVTGTIAGLIGRVSGMVSSIDPVSEEESALRHLGRGISIFAPTDSSVVSISYRTDSPEVSQSVVDAWVDSYITQHAKVNRTFGTYDFFRSQSDALENKLDGARIALQDAKSEFKLVTIPGTQLMLEGQMASVRKGLLDVETEIAAADSRLDAFDEILKSSIDATITEETSGKSNEARDQMRSQLFGLELQENDLRSKLTEDHPKLLAVQRQLAEVRKIMSEQKDDRKEVRRSVNPAHQQLSEYQLVDVANRNGLRDKRKTLQAKREQLILEMSELNEHERLIATLTQKVSILEARYIGVAEKLEQARLDQVLEDERITSVSVVQAATFEQRPVTPNKALCAIAGFLAACAAAISLPILLETRESANAVRRRDNEAHDWQFDVNERPSSSPP